MSVRAKAVVIERPGEADVLAIADREVRDPGAGEIRVRVHATGLNRADLLQRRGLYPAPLGSPADVPGLEYAGEIEAIGQGVPGWRIGDPVMGLVGGGAMCTHVVVHAREAIRVPRGIEIVRAAAIPEVFGTVWDAVVIQAGLGPGRVLLVHAIASGIGTAAIQIARALSASCVGTSRSAEKLERCERELALEHGIVVPGGEAQFAAELERRIGRGADVILDTVGAAYLGENLRAIAAQGTIVVIGTMGGAAGSLPLGVLLTKRARLIGSVLRARPLEEKIVLARAIERDLVPLFERGTLRPVIDAVLPINEIAEAHRLLETNATFGKLVLCW